MGLTDIAISESFFFFGQSNKWKLRHHNLPGFETEGVKMEAKLVPSSLVLHSTITDFIILLTDIDMDMADTSEWYESYGALNFSEKKS